MSKIKVTPEEANWLRTNLTKIQRTPLHSEKSRLMLVRVLSQLSQSQTNELDLKKGDKHHLYKLLQKILQGLEDGVIPRYRRLNMSNYLENAQNKAEMLSLLKEKLK
jgi:hypothetical protein